MFSLVSFPGSRCPVFNDLLFQAEWIEQVFIQQPDKLTQVKFIRFLVLKLITEFILMISSKNRFFENQSCSSFSGYDGMISSRINQLKT